MSKTAVPGNFCTKSLGSLTLSCLAAMTWISMTFADVGAEREALLRIHEAILQAHRDGDVNAWLHKESGHYVSANRGEITFPTKEQRRQRREPYLQNTTFTAYRDIREPIIEVSDDGTLGWLIAQVEIAGKSESSEEGEQSFSTVYVWIELYRKEAGRWLLVGNVSNSR